MWLASHHAGDAQMSVTELSVLVCVDDERIRDVIALLLEEEGYTTVCTDVATWLASDRPFEPLSSAMILDSWPLRSAAAAAHAHTRTTMQSIPIILLVDTPHSVLPNPSFGAVAMLPLCFSFHELLAAVQQATGCVPPAVS